MGQIADSAPPEFQGASEQPFFHTFRTPKELEQRLECKGPHLLLPAVPAPTTKTLLGELVNLLAAEDSGMRFFDSIRNTAAGAPRPHCTD